MTNHDEIQRRAYELYEARGRADGDDWADWLEAERELHAEERSAGQLVVATEGKNEVPRRRRREQVAVSA